MVHQLQYRQLGGFLGKFVSDIFHSKITSTRGNDYTTVFANRGNFTYSVPMEKKSKAHEALNRFLSVVGIPREMLTDGALELYRSEWGKLYKRHSILQKTTEPDSHWQNPTELRGGIIKRRVKNKMRTTNTPV